MWHLKLQGPVTHHLQSRRGRSTSSIVILLCLVLFISVLASCGSTTAGQTTSKTQTTPLVSSTTAPPTSTQISTPSPTPTVASQATPTSPPPPAVLDLQPASMSFLGHRDCPANGTFVCYARVVSGSANQSELNWSAYTNVPGKIVFSPSSGALAPGQSVVVTITIPSDACKAGLFFFQGPVNTHTITWAC